MYGHMRFFKIRNELIRGRIGLTFIEDSIREVIFRWFGYIKRRMDTLVRRYEKIDHLEHKRGRGRPKKNWSEVIRHDLKTL